LADRAPLGADPPIAHARNAQNSSISRSWATLEQAKSTNCRRAILEFSSKRSFQSREAAVSRPRNDQRGAPGNPSSEKGEVLLRGGAHSMVVVASR